MFIQTAAFAAISLLLSALTCPMAAQAASELTTIRIAHNGFSGRKTTRRSWSNGVLSL